MGATRRYGWYLAALQFFFALTWTVYVVYLPKLAAAAGIAPKAIILIWLPTLCWSVAGAALLYLAASRAKRWLMR